MVGIIESGTLLLALLNPFLLIVYLVGPMKKLDQTQFRQVLIRAGIIAGIVFCCFTVLGDVIFSTIIQAEFASFQMFGGLVFIIIGLQFVFKGPTAIEILQGEAAHISGAIAMPVLIGPGTISASVIIGKRHEPFLACGIVLVAVFVSVAIVVLLKTLHDYVQVRREALIERYIEIAGRITALYVGTVAVEMVMKGLKAWFDK
ncbi:MarC family protein [Zooshikella sp. RANM57]|uniref:MarC family protein n=1 Tax=Zooshikella sp. RANM57 TaxID=3425863 RepID=UPI003D6FD08D